MGDFTNDPPASVPTPATPSAVYRRPAGRRAKGQPEEAPALNLAHLALLGQALADALTQADLEQIAHHTEALETYLMHCRPALDGQNPLAAATALKRSGEMLKWLQPAVQLRLEASAARLSCLTRLAQNSLSFYASSGLLTTSQIRPRRAS